MCPFFANPSGMCSLFQSSKMKSSDLKDAMCGGIILAVGIVAWAGMAKSCGPPPHPR